jgi:hypothetical protein
MSQFSLLSPSPDSNYITVDDSESSISFPQSRSKKRPHTFYIWDHIPKSRNAMHFRKNYETFNTATF